MIRVAINGFGRIGRNLLRTILLDENAQNHVDVVAINLGPARIDFCAYMFKYDTLMGTYPGIVEMDGDFLIVDGKKIKILTECDPRLTNWQNFSIDWVVESSGHFTDRDGAQKHIEAGAKYVLISAPAKKEDAVIIPGINENTFDKSKHHIVSLGSCTTNAMMPMLKVLHDTFGIKQGSMTTVHAYTNTQVLLDVEDKTKRRSRAAALNIIPTTTGAMKMLPRIIPELADVVQGIALRVPVGKVSLIDFSFYAGKKLTIDAIHTAFINAAKDQMRGIINLTMEPLVSHDYYGCNYSAMIDGTLTQAIGSFGKVFGWYDNEWGYSERLKDFLIYASKH